MSEKNWKDKKIPKLNSFILILISLFFILSVFYVKGNQRLFLPIFGIVITLFLISDKKRTVELSDKGIVMSKSMWNSKDCVSLRWDEVASLRLTQGLITMWIGYEIYVSDKNNKFYNTYVQDNKGFIEALQNIKKSNKNLDRIKINLVKDIKI